MVEPEESTETDASAASEAPRKRVPRPKPPVIDEDDVPAEIDPTAAAAPVESAEDVVPLDDVAVHDAEDAADVVAVDDVEPDLAAEVVTEDLAQAEGTTGDAIDIAALDAVADAPGSFGTPGAASTPSVNGVKAAPQSTSTVAPSAFPAQAAGPKRFAPALGIAALAVLIIRRRRRRR